MADSGDTSHWDPASRSDVQMIEQAARREAESGGAYKIPDAMRTNAVALLHKSMLIAGGMDPDTGKPKGKPNPRLLYSAMRALAQLERVNVQIAQLGLQQANAGNPDGDTLSLIRVPGGSYAARDFEDPEAHLENNDVEERHEDDGPEDDGPEGDAQAGPEAGPDPEPRPGGGGAGEAGDRTADNDRSERGGPAVGGGDGANASSSGHASAGRNGHAGHRNGKHPTRGWGLG